VPKSAFKQGEDMNVELLERTKAAIMGENDFSMGTWCKCIGHYVCIAADIKAERNSIDVFAAIEPLLGISHDQAKRLCYLELWPVQFGSTKWHLWSKNKENAIRRIDYFIATNGTDALKADLPETYAVHEPALENRLEEEVCELV